MLTSPLNKIDETTIVGCLSSKYRKLIMTVSPDSEWLLGGDITKSVECNN